MSAPAKYRKRAVVVEAIQWTGSNLTDVISFTGWHESARSRWTWEEYVRVVDQHGLKIFTLEGPLMASIGDWIIRGVKGEFYPCQPDVFLATYEPASDPAVDWKARAEAAEAERDKLIAAFDKIGAAVGPVSGWLADRPEDILAWRIKELRAEIERLTHEAGRVAHNYVEQMRRAEVAEAEVERLKGELSIEEMHAHTNRKMRRYAAFVLTGSEDGDLQSAADTLKAEVERLRAENKTFRAAQKACEDCDAPTMADVAAMRQKVRRLTSELAKAEGLLERTLGYSRTTLSEQTRAFLARGENK